MKKIPLVDLGSEYRLIEKDMTAALSRVFQTGQFILGEEVSLFEKEFSSFCAALFGVGVASGTDALHLALRACEVGPGDEVITSAHTAIATLVGIELSGAKPVLVDIAENSFNIDISQIE